MRVGMVRMLEDRVQVGMGMLSERTLLTLWMSNHWVRSGREVTVRELILSESVEMIGHGSLVGLAAAVAGATRLGRNNTWWTTWGRGTLATGFW